MVSNVFKLYNHIPTCDVGSLFTFVRILVFRDIGKNNIKSELYWGSGEVGESR